MKRFTDSQNQAINTNAPKIACVAGPGSGKTSVLVERVRRLIAEGTPPEEIVVLTFTNAAARELEQRLAQRKEEDGFPPRITPEEVVVHGVDKAFAHYDETPLGYCGTLHSYALRALRRHGAAIGYGERLAVLDEEAAADLLASKAKANRCKTPVKRLLELKAAGRPAVAKGDPMTTEQTVVAAYLDDLRENGIVDLDVLLPEFLRLLTTLKGRNLLPLCVRHLLVDEAQDSSAQDWAIYDAFPAMDKFVVGDPDQAVYSWRGGRQDLFRSFIARNDVNVVFLEENFRCSVEVCAAADRLISHNQTRIIKRNIPRSGAPDGITTACGYETEGEEVGQVVVRIRSLLTEPEPVEPSQVAVLARTNAIAAGFRDALKAAGIPVAEPPKSEAPPDWSLARALVDLLAQPDNDTLAFFYVAARERRRGATASEAAAKAHGVRLEAGKARQSVNGLWFKLPRNPALHEVGKLLDREGLTAETRANVNKLISQLPPGSGVLELAADMGSGGMFHVSETASGVHVGTVHGAKGREWDQVFLVGYEDEVTPGKTMLPEVVEEERRLAFVGVTRARVAAHFTHAAQRRATWGRQEVLTRTASRFIKEASQ